MHILDAEQMRKIQQELLTSALSSHYLIKTPNPSKIHKVPQMDNTLFPKASIQTENEINKIVKLTNNVIAIPLSDPNALFRILVYGILSIVYSQKEEMSSKVNTSLLEALKCSLYSKDINLQQIKNKKSVIENITCKAMMANFFSYLSKNKEFTFNCAMWLLQQNKLLIEIFILMFRSILVHLQIEQAEDYQQKVDVAEAVTNLVEYFDLSYRNFGEMLLFYEQGLFLMITQRQLVFGQYFENQTDLSSTRQQSPRKQQPEKPQEIVRDSFSSFKNINSVIQSDMKKFYFMLDSSHSSQVSKGSIHEKDIDIETPYFHDNNEQFNFGRKKKEEVAKQDEFTNQVQRLIMDIEQIQSEADSRHLPNVNQQEAPTPCLGIPQLSNTFDMMLSFQRPSGLIGLPRSEIKLMEIQQVDSPVQEYSEDFSQVNLSFSKRATSKNLVLVKDKFEAPFSPQGDKMAQSNDIYSSQAYEAGFRFLTQQATHKSSESNRQPVKVACLSYKACECRFQRLKRNTVASKVVDLVLNPQKVPTKTISQSSNSPKFLSLKTIPYLNQTSTNCKSEQNTAKDQSLDQSQEQQVKKQERMPTFLKFLKKDKNQHVKHKQQQQNTNKATPAMKNSKISTKIKHKQGVINPSHQKNKPTSISISQHLPEKQITLQTSKSINKLKATIPSKYRKTVYDQTQILKKYDQASIANPRPAFAEPGGSWQSVSNFYRKSNNSGQVNKNINPVIFDSNNSGQLQSKSPLKFYAPTVYFTTNQGENTNRIFFEMNNQMPAKQYTEVRKSQTLTNSNINHAKEVVQSHQIDNSTKHPSNKY